MQSGLTLNSDGILGPLSSDLPAEGLDLSEIPPAEDSFDISEIPPAEDSVDSIEDL